MSATPLETSVLREPMVGMSPDLSSEEAEELERVDIYGTTTDPSPERPRLEELRLVADGVITAEGIRVVAEVRAGPSRGDRHPSCWGGVGS